MRQLVRVGKFEVRMASRATDASLDADGSRATLVAEGKTVIINFRLRTITGPDINASYTILENGHVIFEAKWLLPGMFVYYDLTRTRRTRNPGVF